MDEPGLDGRLARQRAGTPAQARHWFDQKLGWVKDFAGDLASWQGLLSIIEQTRRQIGEDGLHAASVSVLRRRLRPIDARGRPFARRVREFIAGQCQRVPEAERYLGCGEVIESIFGKYKTYLERSPSPSLGTNVLLFPLLVTRLTPTLVAEAMEDRETSNGPGFYPTPRGSKSTPPETGAKTTAAEPKSSMKRNGQKGQLFDSLGPGWGGGGRRGDL